MKIKNTCFFDSSILFIKNDYVIDSGTWEVRDFLGNILLFPPGDGKIIIHTGDPAYWYDWKELLEEAVAKDKSILDEEHGLTLEQGLVAIQYFLEQRYWLKNKDMLLKDAYDDLVATYNSSENNLESSQLWQEWLEAVAVGKKFEKVFQSGD